MQVTAANDDVEATASYTFTRQHTMEADLRTGGAPVAPDPAVPIIRAFLNTLAARGVRYCHWKSNIRLLDALTGEDDVDLLVAREDAGLFHAALLAHGFKLAKSQGGIDHPGVFHALGLDEANGRIVHVHAYTQIVTGDSLVKSYRLPVETALLAGTSTMYGVPIPSADAELVVFVLRMALKHVSAVEIAMANRNYGDVLGELAWLRERADEERAIALCGDMFPEIGGDFFRELLTGIASQGTLLKRIVLGWRVARKLRARRRLSVVAAMLSRLWRVIVLIRGRWHGRRDLSLLSGGAIIAFVGPKATGKSTLTVALGKSLGEHLGVKNIHAGKPPPTLVSLLPRMLLPMARRLFQSERPGEYEKAERRAKKSYSLLFVLRMVLAAYDRRRLLLPAMRAATAGCIIISDRFPSQLTGAIDSSVFDDDAIANCRPAPKRWLMQLERALYRSLPTPDTIIRLKAPLAETLARDSNRGKEGGPDAEALNRRWDLETQAYLQGHDVVEIDTCKPLDVTKRAVVKAAWQQL